jgi:hypothetical protein
LFPSSFGPEIDEGARAAAKAEAAILAREF